jgi:hypothetical protein
MRYMQHLIVWPVLAVLALATVSGLEPVAAKAWHAMTRIECAIGKDKQ